MFHEIKLHCWNYRRTYLLISDDDYTTQLAEVHSVMASLSRRVSCDVDLCHLDVIAAIDTLVEKMAFELQQGTLSAADIMQE